MPHMTSVFQQTSAVFGSVNDMPSVARIEVSCNDSMDFFAALFP